MDAFHTAVLTVVRSIPRGSVASYGQIAAYVGAPRAAREVGWAMGKLGGSEEFPWWRVLNSEGNITISGNSGATPELQQRLLEEEGVLFVRPLALDMDRYQYRADEAALSALGLSSEYISSVLQKYPPYTDGGLFSSQS